MSDQRIMVLPAEVVVRVDENRGDVSRAEFINLLLDSHLGKASEKEHEKYVTAESLQNFEEGMKELLRSFLDFFITYGLEVGKGSGSSDLEAITERLKESPEHAPAVTRRKSTVS